MLSAPERIVARNVPERYRDATLESYVASTPSQRKALDAARAVADESAKTAVFVGPPGVGKSHLAAAVCHARAAAVFGPYNAAVTEYNQKLDAGEYVSPIDKPRQPIRLDPQWVNVPSLVVDLKAEMNLDKQEMTTWMRSLRGHEGLVVLDDIGRERISEWTGELLYTVVNDRYEFRLPTIATSNLSAQELVAAGYWPAISRLAQDGALVHIEGADQRLQKRDPA